MDKYLLEFRGGNFPLSAIGSYKGSSGGVGRKGRDNSKLRRSNTSPRKKGGPAWSCGGSLREGEMDTQSQSRVFGSSESNTTQISKDLSSACCRFTVCHRRQLQLQWQSPEVCVFSLVLIPVVLRCQAASREHNSPKSETRACSSQRNTTLPANCYLCVSLHENLVCVLAGNLWVCPSSLMTRRI